MPMPRVTENLIAPVTNPVVAVPSLVVVRILVLVLLVDEECAG